MACSNIASGLLAVVGSSLLFMAVIIGNPSVAHAAGSGTCFCEGCPSKQGGFADPCSTYACSGDDACDSGCGCTTTNFPFCNCQ